MRFARATSASSGREAFVEPRDFERWLAGGDAPGGRREAGSRAGASLRAEREPRTEAALRAPDGFADRVMARVLESEAPAAARPAAEPARIPRWIALAS